MIGPQYPSSPIESRVPLDTLGVLELSSIAQGVLALDAMLKESPIRVADARAASPGKYLILIVGEVDEVSRALSVGIETAGEHALDDLLLPQTHEELRNFLTAGDSDRPTKSAPTTRWSEYSAEDLPALGIIETYGAPSLLGAVDTALKTAETRLIDLHLLAGIGGKATAILAGDLESVRVGVEAGACHALDRKALANQVVVPRPDPAMAALLTRKRAST